MLHEGVMHVDKQINNAVDPALIPYTFLAQEFESPFQLYALIPFLMHQLPLAH